MDHEKATGKVKKKDKSPTNIKFLEDLCASVKQTYEDECDKANLNEQKVNDILKKRMQLLHEYNDIHQITHTLLAKYASITNCSLIQAMNEFGVPTTETLP